MPTQDGAMEEPLGQGQPASPTGSPPTAEPPLWARSVWVWPAASVIVVAILGEALGTFAGAVGASVLVAVAVAVLVHGAIDSPKAIAIGSLVGIGLLALAVSQFVWRAEAHPTESGPVAADLRGRELSQQLVDELRLKGSALQGADLMNLDLTRQDLSGAQAAGANFAHSDLEGTPLDGADLRGANLRGACLRRASMLGADLSGADVSGADVTDAVVADQTRQSASAWPSAPPAPSPCDG